MPAEEAPDDEDERIRQTYNFAPGYHGLIYRAQTGGYGDDVGGGTNDSAAEGEPSPKKGKTMPGASQTVVDDGSTYETKYKLQAARWGLIPFWTKRPPDYGSQMKTINCRDDSLIENRGMWNTMKQRKRCIVIAEGFFEWLKKNNGKEKIPHFTKRKDGQLMCFAGLYDMCQYEGSDEKLYTYTIITTDSNTQLKFLHDRMPVILEPGSEEMRNWLDPTNVGWSKELQSILKPYDGKLECYPVDKAVGKVGNSSPSFVIPIDSKENKKNIANFFGTQRATASKIAAKNAATRKEQQLQEEIQIKYEADDRDTTTKLETTEDNAPLPKPEGISDHDLSRQIDNEADEIQDSAILEAANEQNERGIKRAIDELDDQTLINAAESPQKKMAKIEDASPPPAKQNLGQKSTLDSQKTRSATSNNTVAMTPKKANAKITSFFGR